LKGSIIIFLTFLLSCGMWGNQKSPSDKKAELYYSHGTSKLIDKDYTTALDYLIKASELKPSSSKIHNNLGMTYYFKKQYTQAEYHLKKSIELENKNSDARNNFASVLFNQKKYKQAENEYKHILRNLVYKHQYRIHYNLSLINLKRHDRNAAHKHLLQAIKLKDDYCPAHILLGQMERSTKNYEKALKHFIDGTKSTCYNIPESHYLKALTLIDLEEFEKATETLDQLKIKFYTSPYSKLAEQRMREISGKGNPGKKSWENLLPSQRRLLRELERESKFEEAFDNSKF